MSEKIKNTKTITMRNFVIWKSLYTGCNLSMASCQPKEIEKKRFAVSNFFFGQKQQEEPLDKSKLPNGWGLFLNGFVFELNDVKKVKVP